MGKFNTIANKKGRVDKATKRFDFATALNTQDKKVSFIETDPKAYTTSGQYYCTNKNGLYEFLFGSALSEFIISKNTTYFDFLPHNVVLSQLGLYQNQAYCYHLRIGKTSRSKKNYGFIIIDYHPSPIIILKTLLSLCKSVIIPV